MLPIILTQDTLYSAPGGIAPQMRSRRAYAVADGTPLVKKHGSGAQQHANLQEAILDAVHHTWDIPCEDHIRAPVRLVPLTTHADPDLWKIIVVDVQWHCPTVSCEQAATPYPMAHHELHDPPALGAVLGTLMAPFSKRWQSYTGGECTVVSGNLDHPFLVHTLDTQLSPYFPNPFLDDKSAALPSRQLDATTIDYLRDELRRALPAALLKEETLQARGEASAKGRL